MTVYLLAIAFSLVEDVDLFFIGNEHLSWRVLRSVEEVMTRALTIIADTKVLPFSTRVPGCCAATEEASPRASKERLEYMSWYSGEEY
jgi:hypothetical protein